MRYGVAKYRVSEEEDMGVHVCSLRFVNEWFIRKRTVLEELSNASSIFTTLRGCSKDDTKRLLCFLIQ